MYGPIFPRSLHLLCWKCRKWRTLASKVSWQALSETPSVKAHAVPDTAYLNLARKTGGRKTINIFIWTNEHRKKNFEKNSKRQLCWKSPIFAAVNSVLLDFGATHQFWKVKSFRLFNLHRHTSYSSVSRCYTGSSGNGTNCGTILHREQF